MKKFKYIAAVFILIVVISLIVHKQKSSNLNPAIFFPEEVMVLIQQRELSKKINDFSLTPMGKAIRSIDFEGIARDVGMAEDRVSLIHKVETDLPMLTSHPLFSEVFGNEVMIGVIEEKRNKNVDPLKDMGNNILVVARPRHGTKILEMIASTFASKIEQSSNQYGKHIIRRYQLDNNNTLSLSRVEDLLVMALSERTIRASLDRYDDGLDSLVQNSDFNQLSTMMTLPDSFIYFSIEILQETFKEYFLNRSKESQEHLVMAQDTWQGVRAGAYGAWQREEKIEDRVIILFEKEKLNSYLQDVISTSPEKNIELSMVSKDTLAYYWTNTFNIASFIKIYENEMGATADDLAKINTSINEFCGVELQELVAAVGMKLGFILQDINSEEFVPLPEFSFFLQLKDSPLIQEVLDSLLTKTGIPFESQIHREVELYFWGLVPQAGMQPVVAFYNNHLIFASSVSMAKKIIDTSLDGNGLLQSEFFTMVKKELLEKNNSITYMQVSQVVEIIKEIVSWGGTMIAIDDRQVAKNSKIIIDKLVNPLLDGLKMYTVLGVRSYIEDDRIITRAETVIKN